MTHQEKNLIENLFYRLQNTELNSSKRDHEADELIQKLLKKQPASIYYMTQTILIQETAIKKMSLKIEELEKKIEELNNTAQENIKPSFLSNFFKKKSSPQVMPYENNVSKNTAHSNNSNSVIPSTTQTFPVAGTTTASSRSSGFLSNALQTATGVAGGMILGNMLMNIFHHTKPEEEIFNSVNQLSSENHQEDSFNDTHNHEFVSCTSDKLDNDFYDNSVKYDDTSNMTSDSFSAEYMDENDINDDNFI